MLRDEVTHFVTEDERLFIKEWASEIRTHSDSLLHRLLWIKTQKEEHRSKANLYERGLRNVPDEIYGKINKLFLEEKVSVCDETGLVVYLDFFGTLRTTSSEPPPLLTESKGESGWDILKAIGRGLATP